MGFDITKQALGAIAGKENVYLEDLLGIMAEDLYQDIKNTGYEQGYEKLPVDDEIKFVQYMVTLTMSIGRMYKENKALFTDESAQRRWGKATKRLADLAGQIDMITDELQRLQGMLDEADKRKKICEEKTAVMTRMEDALEERRHLLDEYEKKIRDGELIREEIRSLEEEKIPALNQQLSQAQATEKEIREYRDKVNQQIAEAEQHYAEYQKNIYSQQKALDDIQVKQSELTNQLEKMQLDYNRKKVIFGQTKVSLLQCDKEIREIQTQIDGNAVQCENLKTEIENAKKKSDYLYQEQIRLQVELETEENHNVGLVSVRESLQTKLAAEKRKSQEYDQCVAAYASSEKAIRQKTEKMQKLQQQIDELQQQLLPLTSQYEEHMRMIRNLRHEFATQKKMTGNAIQDYAIQVASYEKEQRWILAKINTLLGDDALNDMYDFEANAYIKELKDKLVKQKTELSQRLENEMRMLHELLTKLENA